MGFNSPFTHIIRNMTEKRPGSNPVGRPPKEITEEQVLQIEELAGHLTVDQMSEYFGICKNAFYGIMSRRPEIYELYKKGANAKLLRYATLLEKKAHGELPKEADSTAMIFYLKTKGRWAEAKEDVRIEHPSLETEEEKQARFEEIKRYTAFKKYETEFADFLKSKE